MFWMFMSDICVFLIKQNIYSHFVRQSSRIIYQWDVLKPYLTHKPRLIGHGHKTFY